MATKRIELRQCSVLFNPNEHSYYLPEKDKYLSGITGMLERQEVEEEIHSILHGDPDMTAGDLYDMYHTNFPMLKPDDFERIVDEYHQWYGFDREDIAIQTFQPDEKKINKKNFF